MYSTIVNVFVIALKLIPSTPALALCNNDNTIYAPVYKSSL